MRKLRSARKVSLPHGMTRRRFLSSLGVLGGSSAIYNSCRAMGLLSDSGRQELRLKPPVANKSKVAILGAGLAGLTAAYELERAGYSCVVLEASHRSGGRNLTIRGGDLVDELGHPNICSFDREKNLYFNAGPARIPGHHRRLLHYCKTFNLPLQIKANSNRLAYLHDTNAFNGEPVRMAEYIADARGFLSELAWKSANKGLLDQALSPEEQKIAREFVRIYGDLNEDGHYLGSQRAGAISDRMLTLGDPHPPRDFKEILKSSAWQYNLHASEEFDWTEPLMEIPGGMDSIIRGFVDNIASPIYLNAQVRSIKLQEKGVQISYQHDKAIKSSVVDYCFNSIPAHFIAGIENNFSNDYMSALNALKPGKLFKIGLQMRERFWEREGIYGGITYTNQPVAQLWYPSHDINTKKGVMLGAYVWGDKECEYFEYMSPAERLEIAAENGEQIHPGYRSYIEHGVSVPWARMNHMMGCGSHFSEEDQKRYFKVLQQPEGRHFMIGDQISVHPGWQEGALASVENAFGYFNQSENSASDA